MNLTRLLRRERDVLHSRMRALDSAILILGGRRRGLESQGRRSPGCSISWNAKRPDSNKMRQLPNW